MSSFSINAKATRFDDNLDARGSAEAVSRCAEDAKGLFTSEMRVRISLITGKHKKFSAKVDTKQYVIQAMIDGGFGPPPKKASTLYVTAKVAQLPEADGCLRNG